MKNKKNILIFIFIIAGMFFILSFNDHNFKRAVDACLAGSQKLSESKITDLEEARKFCEDQIEKNKDNKEPVGIVDVFRPSKEAYAIAEDTVKIGAKVLWLQLGIRDEEAKKLMDKNNIDYIENKCTKMEYQKYFLKKMQAFPVLSN